MKIIAAFFLSAILVFILAGCKSDITTPDNSNSSDQISFETVDNELAFLKDGGMPLNDAAGVFSIGWNELFRPFGDTGIIKGMAFAAAFGERETDLTHFRKFGLDMGDVLINYSGNQRQLHKRYHWRRGFAYSLFGRPFGVCHPDSLLPYLPNTEYQFQVTGSEVFTPVTFALTSPSELMNITSPAQGTIINPTEDLTLNWTGGEQNKKTAIRVMPHLAPQRGPGGHHHPPFDRVIRIVLDTNPGTYTFPAQQIQRMLQGIIADGIIAEVSQVDFGEVTHQNGTLKTAMRNCGTAMFRLPR